MEDLYHGNINNTITVTVTSQKVELYRIERAKFWKEVSTAHGIKPLVEMKDEKYRNTILNQKLMQNNMASKLKQTIEVLRL